MEIQVQSITKGQREDSIVLDRLPSPTSSPPTVGARGSALRHIRRLATRNDAIVNSTASRSALRTFLSLAGFGNRLRKERRLVSQSHRQGWTCSSPAGPILTTGLLPATSNSRSFVDRTRLFLCFSDYENNLATFNRVASWEVRYYESRQDRAGSCDSPRSAAEIYQSPRAIRIRDMQPLSPPAVANQSLETSVARVLRTRD